MKKQDINIHYNFYSEKRWNNWIHQIKNCNFIFGSENEEEIYNFINMVDDVILACLKIIARFDKHYFDKNQSIENILKIKKIVLKKIDPISEDIDSMLESIQNSLLCVFISFETYIYKNLDNTIDIILMIEEAIKNEDEKNFETSLNILSMIGASIISGQKYDSNIIFDKINKKEGIINDWIDGLDAISVFMNGTHNYKNFDD